MKTFVALFLSLISFGSIAQTFMSIGTDPNGDCTTTCGDIRELEYDFDIALDSAWFKIITYQDRANNDGYYIHVNWEDSDTDGDDWTGGSYILDFNQNRQINIMYGSTYYWIEEFDSGGGTGVTTDVNVSFPNNLTTVINCRLSDIDPDMDGVFKMAASVGNSSYGIYDILPDAGELSSAGSASIEDIANQTISIFPNPAETKVNIRFVAQEFSQVNILNTLGREVYSKQVLTEDELSVDLTNFPAGIYLVQLVGDVKIKTKRLIVR